MLQDWIHLVLQKTLFLLSSMKEKFRQHFSSVYSPIQNAKQFLHLQISIFSLSIFGKNLACATDCSKIIWQLEVSTEIATTTLKNCARLSRLNNNFREIDIQLLTNVFVCLFIDYVCQLTKEVKSYFLKSKTSGVETVFLREAEQINFFFHDSGTHPSQNWELFGPFFNQIQPEVPGFWSGLLDPDWGQASWVQLPAP